jgi:hypothetical protein
VADALSRFEIHSPKIQEETGEALKLLSQIEDNKLRTIKLQTSMCTALILKEQEKIKEPGFREKILAQHQYSIQGIEGYDLICYKDNMQDLHS